jgi:hypothetical protein
MMSPDAAGYCCAASRGLQPAAFDSGAVEYGSPDRRIPAFFPQFDEVVRNNGVAQAHWTCQFFIRGDIVQETRRASSHVSPRLHAD